MQRIEHEDLDTRDGVTFTWQEQPFTGTAYGLRRDGTLQEETEYVDGRVQGRYRTWHPSGQLKSELIYDDTTPYRTELEWDEAGQLRVEVLAEYGFRVAEKRWDAEGRQTMDEEITPSDPLYETIQKIRALYGRAPRPDPEPG